MVILMVFNLWLVQVLFFAVVLIYNS